MKWMSVSDIRCPEPIDIDTVRKDADPNLFSNNDIVCEHGQLDPGKNSNMKRIKRVGQSGHSRIEWLCLTYMQAAYDRIVSEDGCQFSPLLGSRDVCHECVKASFIGNTSPLRAFPTVLTAPRVERLYQIEHPRLVTLFDDVSQVSEDQHAYWISKQWLKGQSMKPMMSPNTQ